MASFTDAPHIAFTPYIETNPTDAYLKVGMHKEQQLQEGVAKVQGMVDAITGLPIIKEEDKLYVQNKLNDLKNGITKNLSGNFSDSRIVSQIAGGAKQIYSDPIIQNSVAGTMAYKKGISDIEEAQKKGTSNIANETVFNDQVNAWLSDKQTGSKYSQYFQGYTPYTDIMAEFKKAWGDTNPGEDIPQDAYYTDNQGHVQINPVLFKGKGPKQIQSVWNLVQGNANVQQQLGINGKYQYRGVTPEQIYQQLGDNTKSFIDNNNNAITTLSAKAAVGDKDAINHIEQLREINTQSAKKLDDYRKGLETNPDAVKSSLVNEQMLQNLIGAYSYQTMEKSPLWETSFQQQQFNKQSQQWGADYQLNRDKFAWQQYTDKMNYDLSVQKEADKHKNETGIPTPAPVGPEAIKDENTARQDVIGAQDQYTQSIRELAYNLSLAGGGQPSYYYDKATNKWEVNAGLGRPFGTKEEADATAKMYVERAKDAYINGTLTGPIADLMENSEIKYRNLSAKQKIISDVENMFTPQTNALIKGLSGIVNNYEQARDYVNAYQVNNKLPGWENKLKTLVGQYGKDWEHQLGIVGNFTGKERDVYIPGRNEKSYDDAVDKLSKNPTLVNIVNTKELEYQKRQTSSIGFNITIPATNSSEKEFAKTTYSAIVNSANELNPSSNKGSYKTFASLLSGKDVDQNVYSRYINPITGEGSLTITRGTDMVSIPVPASEILRHWPESSTYSAFREKFQPALDLNRGITTNVTGNFSNAFPAYQGITSPYVVKYDVNSTGDGNYNIKWYVGLKPKVGESPKMLINGEILGEQYGIPNKMTEEQIMAVTNQLKDKTYVEKIIALNSKLGNLINNQ